MIEPVPKSLGPKLLRVDLAAECRALEAELGTKDAEPGVMSAARRVTDERLADQKVAALEESRSSIERVRHGDRIIDAEPDTVIQLGDVVAAVGHRAVSEPESSPRCPSDGGDLYCAAPQHPRRVQRYGMQIMTPAYVSDPAQPKMVPPEQSCAGPARRDAAGERPASLGMLSTAESGSMTKEYVR